VTQRRYLKLLLASFILFLAWISPSDCKAELELQESALSTAATDADNPWAVKLPIRRAGVKEKSVKAQTKWNRLKRGMFPRELAEMRFRQRAGADGVFDPRAYVQAKESIIGLEKRIKDFRKTPDPSWVSLGPEFVGGRIADILFHPQDPGVIWVASPGGGIWKTADGGKTWKICQDFLSVLTVDTLALSAENPSKLFAGSGDLPVGSSRELGVGILISQDGGETWGPTLIRAGGPALISVPVFRILTNPARPGRIMVGDAIGLIRSEDDGKTLERVFTGVKDMVADLAFDPTNPDVVYATYGLGGSGSPGTMVVSRTGGTKGSWEQVVFPGLPGAAGRIAVGIGAKDGVVYASIGNPRTQGALALYRSSDRGVRWEKVFEQGRNGPDYLAYYDENDKSRYSGGQQWYVNAIAVDPGNSNVIILGGIDLYRSENGGKTIEKVSRWDDDSDRRDLPYVHADIHRIRFSPYYPSVVYACTDGALFVSRDSGLHWERVKASLPITQIYHFALHPSRESVIAGTQDNGTVIWRSGDDKDWWEAGGGDGAFCGWDQQYPSLKYGSIPHLGIWRREWHYFVFVTNGIEKQDRRLFIAPFLVDPKDGDHALAGTTRLYRNIAFRASGAALPNPWTPVSRDLTGGSNWGAISWIALDPSDSKVCWVGSSDGSLHVCRDLDAREPKFERVGEGQLPQRAWISCIAVSYGDPNCVFVTYTTQKIKQVWGTTDGGKTWKPRAKDLPQNLPVGSIIFDPRDAKRLYLGTDIGVFTSNDAGENWEPMNRGLQFAPVTHLTMKGDTLYASTFGRGLYKTRVGEETTTKSPGKTPIRLLVEARDNQSMMAVAKLVDENVTAHSEFRTVTSFNELDDVTVRFGGPGGKGDILVMNNTNEVYGRFTLDNSSSPNVLADRIWDSIQTVGMLSRIRLFTSRDPRTLEVKYSPDKSGLAEFALGEPFEVRVRPRNDAYLYAFKLSDSGALQLLFPAGQNQPRLVRREEWLRLALKATGKPGSEKMLLLASGKPLQLSELKSLEEGNPLVSLAVDLGILSTKKGLAAQPVDYTTRLLVLDTVDPSAGAVKDESETPKAMLWKMLKEKSRK